jgi:hypothetical protein
MLLNWLLLMLTLPPPQFGLPQPHNEPAMATPAPKASPVATPAATP